MDKKAIGRDDDWGIVTESDGSTQITNLVGDSEFGHSHKFIRNSNSSKNDSTGENNDQEEGRTTPTKALQIEARPTSKTKDGWNFYQSTGLNEIPGEEQEEGDNEPEETHNNNFAVFNKNEDSGETEILQESL